jgi:hypothetical protein
MTVSACLLPFAKALKTPTDAAIRALLAKQPKQCPREGCTGTSCHAVCREWAAMQWQVNQRKGSGKR